MKKKENCIQLKIDNLIANINSKNYESNNSQDEINDVITLISFSHCIDLFDFLENYSKIQKNELLFKIAFTYDMLGYNKKSLEFINEALRIIPNVPTIILFKSGLYASMNKLDEAQKYLLKFKYLIGEDIYNNYIYNCIRIVYYYLLEYEENIILREINLIERNFTEFYNDNVILYFIKSKLFQKLAEKFKKIDKVRSLLYQKDSNQAKEKANNNGKLDSDYLYENDIHKESTTKLLLMIYPNFIDYKPKPLVEYNFKFHTGFGLFLTLFKLCKIIKLKIHIKSFKKINKNYNSKKNLLNNFYNIIQEISQLNSTNFEDSPKNVKECQESILKISKSAFLENFIYHNKSIIYTNKSSSIPRNISNRNTKIKEGRSLKNFNLSNNTSNINNQIKTNYYVYKGYYSSMNLNGNIIKNINFNKEFKEKILGKDSLMDDLDETFLNNLKENKSNDDVILEDSYIEDNENNNLDSKKSNNMNNEKNQNYKIKLIHSIQDKKNLKFNENDKRQNLNIENGMVKDPKTFNNYQGENKIDKRKDNNQKLIDKKEFNKAKKSTNSINKIFNNTNKFYTMNVKEKDLSIVNEFDKMKESNNETNINNEDNINEKNNNENKIDNMNTINYDINRDKNLIKTIQKNENIKDIDKYFIKKVEKNEVYKKKKREKLHDKISQTEKTFNLVKKNVDKMAFNKSTTENQKFKRKNMIKNNTSKPIKKNSNKKSLKVDISNYNTINARKDPQTKKNNSTKTYNNYLSYNNINKILKNNMGNKKAFLEFRTVKENPKSENKKMNDILFQEKVNFLTINIGLLSKTKACTPKYQKIAFFRSFKSESKEGKKNNPPLRKVNKNSPNYMIRLKKKFKNNKLKINYNVPKPSFNKFSNNNIIKKSVLYFDNIMGSNEVYTSKNSSFYKLEKSFTNKSNS